MLSNAVAKSMLLLASGIGMHVSMSPPNPPSDKRARGHWYEIWVYQIVVSIKMSFWILIIADIFASTVVATSEQQPSSILCPSLSSSASHVKKLTQPSGLFHISAVVTALSGVLRALCFAALGPLFRFDVGIQPNHRLITSGPYSVVRHPSYIACIVSLIGGLGVVASQGSFTRECLLEDLGHLSLSGMSWLAVILFIMYTANSAITGYYLVKRLGWEEEVLRREFGNDWDRYTEKVRYKIIPGFL